ncbi:hypothetical protein NPIL_37891 [Nephila pilipes]|uniref:Uncharacterized protein n=1 Tax=Nephila pilipes TaxID=299642 RepID=A0A8X6NBK9_NEPPI|nr:hypothetical protein NPIL_37891 [Nephila pilipes]
MASNSRSCENLPVDFSYICGEYSAILKVGDCFKYLKEEIEIGDLLKGAIFVGTDIRKLMKDKEFETSMTAKEKEAWVAVKDVIIQKFSDDKDLDYKAIVIN